LRDASFFILIDLSHQQNISRRRSLSPRPPRCAFRPRGCARRWLRHPYAGRIWRAPGRRQAHRGKWRGGIYPAKSSLQDPFGKIKIRLERAIEDASIVRMVDGGYKTARISYSRGSGSTSNTISNNTRIKFY